MAGVSPTEGPGTRQQRTSALLRPNRESTRNFKASEAAKEMAKTDDNVKEFLEKEAAQGLRQELGRGSWLLASLELGRGSWLLASLELGRGSWLLASLELGRGSWLLASLELGRGSWLLVSLELGRGSWLLVSLELGRGSWLMVSLELGRGSWLLVSLELGRGSWRLGKLVGLTNAVLDTVLTANPCMWWQTYGHGFGVPRDVAIRLLSIPATSASTERVFSTFKHIWSDHRQSMLMGRMWMSSCIYFNRRALKGTWGQTRSSEEERAEFEEWLQHQPNGISE
ncbi:hypothetical protein QJQ45_003681 [Haematococcus lacustris]|nr:hypothetical protein QJQ45_003681 [Haematococcus lacustris]